MANEKRLDVIEQRISNSEKSICEKCSHRRVCRAIDNQPCFECNQFAEEVVHGHWTSTDMIVHKAGYSVRYYYHAECKVNPNRLFECENDYCPNCGAKMDGGNENV